jgi:hypothetical protein
MVRMTETGFPRKIGTGPRGLGSNAVCVISEGRKGKYIKDLIQPNLKAAPNMTVSIIAWRIFWGWRETRDPAALDRWLERWAFADDGVRISIGSHLSRREEHQVEIELTPSTER